MLAREIGPIDILFNCAGFVHHGTVLTTSDADRHHSCSTSTSSRRDRTIGAFLPGMLEKGRGSIVNIASGASSVRGIPNRYVYGASKAAVIGLTKSVAADYIRKGIRCNAICPGTIESPSLDSRIETLSKTSGQAIEAVRQAFVDRPATGPASGQAGGDRRDRPLPRLGRERLCYRPDLHHRWRICTVRLCLASQ